MHKQGKTLALIVIALGAAGSGCAQGDISEMTRYRAFTGIYEPSGVHQLADERFILVQDEPDHPLDICALRPDGTVAETPLYRAGQSGLSSSDPAMQNLADLEAVASDATGRIYAISSHSRKQNGKRDGAREQLVRFRIEGDRLTDIEVVNTLRKAISVRHPSLKRALKVRDVKNDGGFNIEGLSFDAQGKQLLIGLRTPQTETGDNAIIIVLENPGALFDHAATPAIGDRLIALDLGGGGIRSLAYDPHLGGYLVISRRAGKPFRLWLWDGAAANKPRPLTIKGLKDLRNAEGVTPVRRAGRPHGILIVSDEGDGRTRKPGRYLLAPYDSLVLD